MKKILLRFEEKAYLNQWMNFRKPTLKDMIPNGIDCGLFTIMADTEIIPIKRQKEYEDIYFPSDNRAR